MTTNAAFEPNVNQFLKQARDAIAAGDWEQARERSVAVLAFDPENAAAKSILERADSFLTGADQPAAAADGELVASLVAKAVAKVDQGDWDRAEERALAVQAVDPFNRDAARIIRASGRRASLFSLEDPQTGKRFPLHFEDTISNLAANVSFVYLLAALLFAIWMAVDTLLGENTLLVDVFGYDPDGLESDDYTLFAMTAIAGFFGGTLDAIRSLVRWHSENDAYGARFLLRDLGMPWIGGAVGVLAYVVVRGGAGTIQGEFGGEENIGSLLGAMAFGFLGGFSSIQVYKWLDHVGDVIFSTRRTLATPAAPEAGEAGGGQ